jgi:1,4-dihydroxy-2-naphthoyl-CoA synthase
LALETEGQAFCMSTEDHQEGLRAFFEKRTPKFTGR